MFDHAATSPYDAFFTSGLLSAARTRFPYSAAATSPTSPDVPLSPRRGSLPENYPLYSPTNDDAEYDDENDDMFNFYQGDAEDTMYFTLQPRAQPSAENLRSFLSLDLAESQSMRSASLRRKPSTSTARSNWSRSTMSRSQSKSTKAYSALRFPQTIPELPSRPNALPKPPHTAPLASTSKGATPSQTAAAAATNNKRPSITTLRMRFSRDSLRTIPSPKPAPCITLPEPPKSSRAGTPVSVHLPASAAVTMATPAMTTPSTMAPVAVPTPASVAVSAPAPIRALTSPATTTICTSTPSSAPEAAPSQAAEPKTPVKTKAPPRLPSLQPIPLELNIRMSALFASPPKQAPPSSFKAPATTNANANTTSSAQAPQKLSKAPSVASSRFISPAPRRLEQRRTGNRNRESVATMLTTRTVSTRARRWNRSEALARLEGRSPVSPDVPAPTTTTGAEPPAAVVTAAKLAMRMSAARNFMSMSDDESEEEGGEMVFLRQVAEGSESDDEDDEEDLDFDDGCSSSSSSSAGSESSSYVSLDAPPVKPAVQQEARESGSSGGSASSSGLSFPSLRGLVGRMAGLNPFMEAEDVVLPVQTLTTPTPTPTTARTPPLSDLTADADVDIDDNFRFPAPPRTTAAERRLSLALSYGSSARENAGIDDSDNLSISVFDGLFLEAPRSAPLPPPPPPYSPFAQVFPAYAQPAQQPKGKHAHSYLAVPGPSSSLALPGLRRKRTKTRRGRTAADSSDAGLVSFIDFPDAPPPASAPPAPRSMLPMTPVARRVIGERSDSLPEEMRELRRRQQRRGEKEEWDGDGEASRTHSRKNSKDSKDSKDGSKSSSSWTWRSFIEVANV